MNRASTGSRANAGCAMLLALAMSPLAAQPTRAPAPAQAHAKVGQVTAASNRFVLKARLSAPANNTRATTRDGHFALQAQLSPASYVCYSDTIFRDDFDGDGF